MTRTRAAIALAVALFGPFACKRGSGDPVGLVPASATVVAGVDVKGVLGSKLYADVKERFESGAKAELAAADKCDLGPDKWKRAVFGADPDVEGAVVAVVVADGVGKKDTLQCIIENTDEPFTLDDDGRTLKMNGDDGVGYVIDDNTVVYAGKAWAGEVAGLRDGKGKSVKDGALAKILGRTDTAKTIWFAGKVPPDVQDKATSEGFAPKDVAGWVHLADGVDISLSAGVDDAEKAKGDAQKSFDQVKPLATGLLGVPASVIDSVKIDSTDGAVTFRVSASEEDVAALLDKIKQQLPM